MRTAVFVLALASCFFSACSLPRDAIGGTGIDAAPALRDAIVLHDAGVDAPGRDAYVDFDAPETPDAWTPPDAYAAPDAFRVPDAFTSPDAWTDPCTVGPDSDGDGVRDACDRCPAHDDRVDLDADGTPDGCDAWPCGASAPTAPPSSVTVGGVTVTGVSVAGMGTVAVVDASAMVQVGLSYTVSDCSCMNCVDQIEIGWSPGSRQFCAYDGNPNCRTVSTGAVTHAATTPATHGQVELRFHFAQDFACGRTTADWYGGPPSDGTIAIVCVR